MAPAVVAKDLSPQDAAREEFFEVNVRPILAGKCAKCHTGEPDAETELRMDSRQALLVGGDFGPALVPGNTEQSLLLQAVRRSHKELKMPPDYDERLSAKEVAALAQWIADGAYWPEPEDQKRGSSSPMAKKEAQPVVSDHWAFQPRTRPVPPEVSDPAWREDPIDQFLEARRQAENLPAVPLADRRTLIRRVTFDLIGLPPTPEEVRSFVEDPAPDAAAYAKLIDRLLASPHYGERWGRHWLDVARYADTQGDVGDIPIPTAYLYRNWVIQALNEDLPFNDFLRAQIAGDILAQPVENAEEARGLVVATGFISLSRRFGNTKEDDMNITIEDTLDTLGRGVLGLTMRCARCHDHKFDPVPTEDYYGLYGIFESTIYPWMGASNEKSPSDLAPVTGDPKDREALAGYWELISRYEYQLNNHFRPWLKPTLDEYKEVCAQMDQEAESAALDIAALEKRREELLKFKGGRFRELMEHGLSWLKDEKYRLAEEPPMELVFAVGEGKGHDAKLHRRGDKENLGDAVPRHFPQVIHNVESSAIGNGSGRLELADWITDDEHPLTPRVIVNRVWMQHFGQGLVTTPDNFGVRGSPPSHPELLDWLTEDFVRSGWSLKKLHRRILMTRTYRLSGDSPPENLAQDPGNVYLWHFPRRRLEAEIIRDATLAVSGELDLSQGGPHPFPSWSRVRFSLNRPFDTEYETQQRSVYLMTQRLFKHSFLGLFDGPDTSSSMAERGESSVPAQALFLMNSDRIQERAEHLAGRLIQSHQETGERIETLYLLAYGRSPEPVESERIQDYLQAFEAKADSLPGETSSQGPQAAWTSVAKAVLTSNEFFFVD